MKTIVVHALLLFVGLQIAASQEAPLTNTLSDEFQNLPKIDVSNMNGYEWAIIQKILVRAAQVSGTTLKGLPPSHGNGVVTVTITGPLYADNYNQTFAAQIEALTNKFLTALGPFVKTIEAIKVNVTPANRSLLISPATASLDAANLKPQFRSGTTIMFSQVWSACINKLGTIPGIEMDAATDKSDNFPWTMKSKWAEAKYKLPGFVVREQITLRVYNWMQGRAIGLSVDSELQMRRLSENNWMAFPMDSQSLSILKPAKAETTQDICIGELSNELKN